MPYKNDDVRRTLMVYAHMKVRCHKRTAPDYSRYGGRGIYVCERWVNSFPAFLTDMGIAPKGMQIDRIDNDGPYSPDNCRWSTRKEQARNRRSSRLVSAFGITATLAEWSERTGIRPFTISYRLRHGWSVEQSLTESVRA